LIPELIVLAVKDMFQNTIFCIYIIMYRGFFGGKKAHFYILLLISFTLVFNCKVYTWEHKYGILYYLAKGTILLCRLGDNLVNLTFTSLAYCRKELFVVSRI